MSKRSFLLLRDFDLIRIKLLEDAEGPWKAKCDNLAKVWPHPHPPPTVPDSSMHGALFPRMHVAMVPLHSLPHA